jgi:hypothetical protein
VEGVGATTGEPLTYYRARYGALEMDVDASVLPGSRE